MFINIINLTRCFSLFDVIRCYLVPKGNQIKSEKDLRPISILPVLSKVYERLIFRQLSDFIEKNNVLNSNISAFWKGQSTTTVLQAIRDDIVKAMKRLEVTMMILADFSKAFDTICFRNLITKLSKLGFSRVFLIDGHSIMLCIVNNLYRSMIRVQRLKTWILEFPMAPSWAWCYSILCCWSSGLCKCEMLPVCGRHNNLRSCLSIWPK